MANNVALYLANSRKALIQFATLVVTIGTLLLTFQSSLPDGYAALITTVVGVAGSLLHYATPNAEAPGTVEATEDSDGVWSTDSEPDVDEDGNAVPNEEPTDEEIAAADVPSALADKYDATAVASKPSPSPVSATPSVDTQATTVPAADPAGKHEAPDSTTA